MAASSSAKMAGSLAKSGASAGLRKSPRKKPGAWPGRVAHRHAAGHGLLAVPAGDLPDQLGLDRPRRVDPPLERVMRVFEELEDPMLSRVLAGHDAGPGHRAERREDRPQRPRGPLAPSAGPGWAIDPGSAKRLQQIPRRPIQPQHKNLHRLQSFPDPPKRRSSRFQVARSISRPTNLPHQSGRWRCRLQLHERSFAQSLDTADAIAGRASGSDVEHSRSRISQLIS